VSPAEIKNAVDALSPEDLAELAAFIRARDNAAWDKEMDAGFRGRRPTSVPAGRRARTRAREIRALEIASATVKTVMIATQEMTAVETPLWFSRSEA
jgi:hypothetical protein